MTKNQRLEKYFQDDPDYYQDLMTAYMIVGDDKTFFDMLDKAEAEGKRISVVEEEDEFSEPWKVEIK